MAPKMSRRYLRAGAQLSILAVLAFILIFYIDSRYRVLPDTLHSYLPTHHPGLVITDLTLSTCSRLNPLSSCSLDSKTWHRIEKDLFLGKSWSKKGYLYVSRKTEAELTVDDHVLVDVRVSRSDPSKEEGRKDESWEKRDAGIWIRRDQRASKKTKATDSEAVTALDVLFGADAVDPRPQWSLVPTALLLSGAVGPHGSLAPHITIRHGAAPPPPKKPVLKVNKSGRFKILQVSDLHFSTGLGECRDAEPPESRKDCEADVRTGQFIERMLDDEKPDLVVLSGDLLNGEGHNPDSESSLLKVAELFIRRQIPYAALFGNHDDEGNLSRELLMEQLTTLPYNMARAGPAAVAGVGNYYLEIGDHTIASHSALTLYVLDTHGLSPDDVQYPGYDWLKPSQLAWFGNASADLNSRHQAEGYSRKHLSLAFLHIPLPEYKGRGDGGEERRVGEWKEPVTAPLLNTGMTAKLVEGGVLTVGCGHDHVNEFCLLHREATAPVEGEGEVKAAVVAPDAQAQTGGPKLWMCYAGGSGFGGYGGYGGYHRRVRVWEIDTNLARITTWKRVEWAATVEGLAAKVDEQIVVRGGKVVEE